MSIITAESLNVQPIEAERQTLVNRAKNIAVYDVETVAEADQILIALATGIANTKEALKPMRDSTTAAWKAGVELEKRLIGPLEDAKKELASRRGQCVKALEQAAQAAAEAASAALDKGDFEAADTLQSAAQNVVAKGPVSSREVWKGEVVDMGALIVAAAKNPDFHVLLLPNESAINKLASMYKDKLNVPGINPVSDFTSTARTATPKPWMK